jgi:protein-L-isoaspartate(D-aspartate) O-methyltransferase
MQKKITYKKIETLLIFLICLLLFSTSTALSGTGKDPFARARRNMIEHDLKGRDITDPVVLKAMEKVKRHLFINKSQQKSAYADHPLPIGEGQTISQPYIVAFMTQNLGLKKGDRVLEIGTGSGYQAAVLAEIAGEVYTIEIKEKLADRSSKMLKSLGYKNIKVKAGDGFFGWKEHAPFDAIILTCAADKIPQPLVNQLKEGGRIILPLGGSFWGQNLILGTKKGGKLDIKHILPVRFVPMTGEAQK